MTMDWKILLFLDDFKKKIEIKAENEKVENGKASERGCQWLKASLPGKFSKCIRELIW